MRKLLTFLTTLTAAVAVIVLFTACEQFLKDPEDFLSYWASEAFVKDHSISSEPRPDGAGVPCVGSSVPVYIMLTVHNPKGFSFVLPTASEPAGIVEFKELFEQPVLGTHYNLERLSSTRLKLTYKEAFLQKYEQGSGSLNPTITLKAKDGRVFKKTYTFGIKSNTPPPQPAVVLAKQTNPSPDPSYYVLCIDTKDLVASSAIVNGKYIHDDIAYVTINGTSYNLKMNNAHNGFSEKPTTESFLANGTGLMPAGSESLPSGAWVLYYKTDIQIGPGNPETSYTITLRDKGGVTSDETVARIEASGPTHTVTFSVVNGVGGTLTATPEGGSENTTGSVLVEHGKNVTFNANPNEGYKVEKWTLNGSPVNGTNKTYTLSDVRDNKTVTVTFKKVWTVTFSVADGEGTLNGSYSEGSLYYTNTSEYVGNEKKFENVPEGTEVSFFARPADGWKVKDWTLNGSSLGREQQNYGPPPITADITVTVEFEKVAAIAGTDNFAWKLLKKAVEIADPNAVITINGEIKASGPSEGDCGEIVINGKSLTIKKADGAASAVLDANTMSRIFKVENGANLILENLKLTGGKADGTEDADKCGGAIYAKNASEIKIENCIITGNEAATNGGGLNVEGTPTTITNCTFTGNTAKNGGGIYIIQGDRIPVVTISGGTIGGTGTGEANKATGSDGNGGGIYVGDRCKVILKNNDSTGCTIKGNTAQRGGGVYANNADVIMSGRTRIAVDNDVYLDGMSPSNARITVTAPLTAEPPVARITPKTYSLFPRVKVLDGNITGGTPQNYTKFAVTPKGDEYWTVDSNGYLSR
ncbi:InlB B-repeat-containing protein [Treponema putidum]|uniref:InlB B-repeat-containing protein n=1 Tax=Treponema putidum TaxID=221027 RepID=UPI003D8F67D6